MTALVALGSVSLAWAQARRAASPPTADLTTLANSLKALPLEHRLQALMERAEAGTWERSLADEALAVPSDRRPALVNLALAEVDHALTEGDGWPRAGIRIALLSGALLGFVAYLSGAPVVSAIADLGIGGVAAILCFEARRSAERSVRRHRRAIDGLVSTVFGEPERSPGGASSTRRRRRA